MAAADVSDTEKGNYTASVDTLENTLNTAKTSRQMAMTASRELASQRMAISDAIGMARTAVDAVNDDSTDAQVDGPRIMAVTNARLAIAGGVRCSGPRESREHRNGRCARGAARQRQDQPPDGGERC